MHFKLVKLIIYNLKCANVFCVSVFGAIVSISALDLVFKYAA